MTGLGEFEAVESSKRVRVGGSRTWEGIYHSDGSYYGEVIRGYSPDLGLKLGLIDYFTSHIFPKKTIFSVLPDRLCFGVNSKMLANPESQYNPRAPWRPFL